MLLALLTTVPLLATISHSAVIPRPQHELRALPFNISLNNVHSALPVGAILNQCIVPGTVALTFDDGPYIYTPELLNTLSAHGARATFFLNGINKGSIEGFPEIVLRAFSEGHQLGSHSSVSPFPESNQNSTNTAVDTITDTTIFPCHPSLTLPSSTK